MVLRRQIKRIEFNESHYDSTVLYGVDFAGSRLEGEECRIKGVVRPRLLFRTRADIIRLEFGLFISH